MKHTKQKPGAERSTKELVLKAKKLRKNADREDVKNSGESTLVRWGPLCDATDEDPMAGIVFVSDGDWTFCLASLFREDYACVRSLRREVSKTTGWKKEALDAMLEDARPAGKRVKTGRGMDMEKWWVIFWPKGKDPEWRDASLHSEELVGVLRNKTTVPIVYKAI